MPPILSHLAVKQPHPSLGGGAFGLTLTQAKGLSTIPGGCQDRFAYDVTSKWVDLVNIGVPA